MAAALSFRQLVGVSPSTASVKDSALIIIDAQNEYAEGKLQVRDVSTSRKVIAALLEKYRSANGQVVHVVHDTSPEAPVFTTGTKLAEEFEELTPRDGEKIVHKNYASSFADTDLQQHLESIGLKKIVLTGYMVSQITSSSSIPC
jgi:nicotinamidase-related amidase